MDQTVIIVLRQNVDVGNVEVENYFKGFGSHENKDDLMTKHALHQKHYWVRVTPALNIKMIMFIIYVPSGAQPCLPPCYTRSVYIITSFILYYSGSQNRHSI